MLTAKAKYAIRVLIYLAGLPRDVWASAAQIIETCHVPGRFTETILGDLKRAAFIISARGRSGGYQLARPADTITWADVIRAIDGPLALTRCVSRTDPGPCDECPSHDDCLIRVVMARVHQAVAAILENLKISDPVLP